MEAVHLMAVMHMRNLSNNKEEEEGGLDGAVGGHFNDEKFHLTSDTCSNRKVLVVLVIFVQEEEEEEERE